jgi:hypothetical protein
MSLPGNDLHIGLGSDSSGSIITLGTPRDSTTASALPEVQQMSDSAFTAAEVLT